MKNIKNLSFTILVIISTLYSCSTKRYDLNFYRDYDSSFVLDQSDSVNVKNVIFFIGDGMGKNQIEWAKKELGVDRLNMEKCQFKSEMTTNNINNETTDSAASGTALACGEKTLNKMVAMRPPKEKLKSILIHFEEAGKSTGVVVTVPISHATPASFLANNVDRNNQKEITDDIIKNDFEVLLGGGKQYWSNENLELALNKGYSIAYDKNQLDSCENSKIIGLFATNYLSTNVVTEPSLVDMTKKALSILKTDVDGFFVMVEGSQIDSFCHDNDKEFIRQLAIFDLAIAEALKFAMKDRETLVIITADHETGGIKYSKEKGKFYFTSRSHTSDKVPIFAYGPQAEKISEVKDNTQFFKIIKSFLN